jgi:hypothetical protein
VDKETTSVVMFGSFSSLLKRFLSMYSLINNNTNRDVILSREEEENGCEGEELFFCFCVEFLLTIK